MYSSYADIDRTPLLFLGDLFTENPKYYHTKQDTFSSFGWCSEREMAFVALVSLLNYQAKVVVRGNHSWTELIVPMVKLNGDSLNFMVNVDNTFDRITWNQISQVAVAEWESKVHGESKMGSEG
jgi:hypothetical protein